MTQTVTIEGECPCGYRFSKTVPIDEIQTSLSDYNDAEDAVHNFCGELPLPPSQLISLLSLLVSLTALSYDMIKDDSVTVVLNEKEAETEATCPECGSSKYELEVTQD